MDVIKLYQDFNIQYQTEGHKHCRPGWVNIECPFCSGNPGLHLGYSLEKDYFRCWRCGFKPTLKTIQTITRLSYKETSAVIREYGGRSKTPRAPKITVKKKKFKFPSGTCPMQDRHKRYLQNRGFDPDELESEWGLLGTGPIAPLDGIDYKHRIIIPIYWKGEIVSFQGRDITGKSNLKYLACPQEREIINHKEVLYAHKSISLSKIRMLVEGSTDVWNIGRHAAATFGIEYKIKQLSQLPKKLVILFDADPQAMQQSKKLAAELSFLGHEVYVKTPSRGKDPGSMSKTEIKQLLEEL